MFTAPSPSPREMLGSPPARGARRRIPASPDAELLRLVARARPAAVARRLLAPDSASPHRHCGLARVPAVHGGTHRARQLCPPPTPSSLASLPRTACRLPAPPPTTPANTSPPAGRPARVVIGLAPVGGSAVTIGEPSSCFRCVPEDTRSGSQLAPHSPAHSRSGDAPLARPSTTRLALFRVAEDRSPRRSCGPRCEGTVRAGATVTHGARFAPRRLCSSFFPATRFPLPTPCAGERSPQPPPGGARCARTQELLPPNLPEQHRPASPTIRGTHRARLRLSRRLQSAPPHPRGGAAPPKFPWREGAVHQGTRMNRPLPPRELSKTAVHAADGATTTQGDMR